MERVIIEDIGYNCQGKYFNESIDLMPKKNSILTNLFAYYYSYTQAPQTQGHSVDRTFAFRKFRECRRNINAWGISKQIKPLTGMFGQKFKKKIWQLIFSAVLNSSKFEQVKFSTRKFTYHHEIISVGQSKLPGRNWRSRRSKHFFHQESFIIRNLTSAWWITVNFLESICHSLNFFYQEKKFVWRKIFYGQVY